MSVGLIDLLGVGDRELVSFTGGGGKTTLLLGLGEELAGRGDEVVITTTTKLGLDQASEAVVCWSDAGAEVRSALQLSSPVFVLSDRDDHKVRGFGPGSVDRLFSEVPSCHILVEADGSRGRPLKAPAAHEPVVPSATTLAVVVVGIDAIGRPLSEAAHRSVRAEALTGRRANDLVDPETAAAVISHPAGGLKGIPDHARVVVAVTKVAATSEKAAARLSELLMPNARIWRVVTVPFLGRPVPADG